MYGTKNISFFNFQKEKIKIELNKGNIHADGKNLEPFLL